MSLAVRRERLAAGGVPESLSAKSDIADDIRRIVGVIEAAAAVSSADIADDDRRIIVGTGVVSAVPSDVGVPACDDPAPPPTFVETPPPAPPAAAPPPAPLPAPAPPPAAPSIIMLDDCRFMPMPGPGRGVIDSNGRRKHFLSSGSDLTAATNSSKEIMPGRPSLMRANTSASALAFSSSVSMSSVADAANSSRSSSNEMAPSSSLSHRSKQNRNASRSEWPIVELLSMEMPIRKAVYCRTGAPCATTSNILRRCRCPNPSALRIVTNWLLLTVPSGATRWNAVWIAVISSCDRSGASPIRSDRLDCARIAAPTTHDTAVARILARAVVCRSFFMLSAPPSLHSSGSTIQGCARTCSQVMRLRGSSVSMRRTRSLAQSDTLSHHGLWNSYLPLRTCSKILASLSP
mmetsp:Transcript_22080/g.77392  ORF Transcript_22080/g.77392 Transcript_22080/m.77392 type:complete len:405 (+) Transcript_22080:120-1334(+)